MMVSIALKSEFYAIFTYHLHRRSLLRRCYLHLAPFSETISAFCRAFLTAANPTLFVNCALKAIERMALTFFLSLREDMVSCSLLVL